MCISALIVAGSLLASPAQQPAAPPPVHPGLVRISTDTPEARAEWERRLARMLRTGALKEVELQIERLVGEAHRALAAAPLTPVARERLAELADYVAWRDH